MNKIFVWIKRPGEIPRHVWISDTLDNLQKTVGGNIEVYPLTSEITIICNEEGKLQNLPYNCTICSEKFVGTIIFVGIKGEEFADCLLTAKTMKNVFPQLWGKE